MELKIVMGEEFDLDDEHGVC